MGLAMSKKSYIPKKQKDDRGNILGFKYKDYKRNLSKEIQNFVDEFYMGLSTLGYEHILIYVNLPYGSITEILFCQSKNKEYLFKILRLSDNFDNPSRNGLYLRYDYSDHIIAMISESEFINPKDTVPSIHIKIKDYVHKLKRIEILKYSVAMEEIAKFSGHVG
jgi:hypothetical protein